MQMQGVGPPRPVNVSVVVLVVSVVPDEVLEPLPHSDKVLQSV